MRLGDFAYYGWAGPVDLAEALRLYSDASGHPQAAFNLGFMHEYGIACTADLAAARGWYAKAMASGSDEAYWSAGLALAKLELLEGLGLHGMPGDELLATALTIVGATAFVAAAFIGITLTLRIRGKFGSKVPRPPLARSSGEEEGPAAAADDFDDEH